MNQVAGEAGGLTVAAKTNTKFSTLEKRRKKNGNCGDDGNRSTASFQTVLALAGEESGERIDL